ncbi:MAG: sulfotransferase [Granulosicoccus sp.]
MKAVEHIVAVGGLGGSGTRVISQILQEAGLRFCADQNAPLDTLAFTLFFNQDALSLDRTEFAERARFFNKCRFACQLESGDEARLRYLADQCRLQQSRQWFHERVDAILMNQEIPCTGNWGWKSPPTHFFTERFLECWQNFRFVMVVRNAYDMILSGNRIQQRFWAHHSGFVSPSSCTLDSDFAFWCYVHRSMVDVQRRFPERVIFISHDRLIAEPRVEVNRLLSFAFSEVEKTDVSSEALYDIPQRPDTKDRGKNIKIVASEENRRFEHEFSHTLLNAS